MIANNPKNTPFFPIYPRKFGCHGKTKKILKYLPKLLFYFSTSYKFKNIFNHFTNFLV